MQTTPYVSQPQRQARIWTSRYANPILAARTDLCKVGITLGRPKFPLRYPYIYLPLLAPEGSTFRLKDRDAFELAFTRQLDRIGLAAIVNALRQISDQAGGRDLVLLCFENLHKPGEWCHRRMVASWLERKCGLIVEELHDPTSEQGKRRHIHTSEPQTVPHYHIVVEWSAEGNCFLAWAPELPEVRPCKGATPSEAEEWAQHAIGCHFEDLLNMSEPLPVVNVGQMVKQGQLW